MSEPAPMHPGLCAACRHARQISSDRGTAFWLCRAHAWHPRLPKYPELPVLSCPAFQHDEGRGRTQRDQEGDEG
jgi:hypothetical protein